MLAAEQPQTGANGMVRLGRRLGLSITYKITNCWVTLLQPARRAAVLDQPSSIRPHLTYSHKSGTYWPMLRKSHNPCSCLGSGRELVMTGIPHMSLYYILYKRICSDAALKGKGWGRRNTFCSMSKLR
jgi:hypothetical protein